MKLCTKLVQWLTLAGLFFGVWIPLVLEILPVQLSHAVYRVILIVGLKFPLISQSLAILFISASSISTGMFRGEFL